LNTFVPGKVNLSTSFSSQIALRMVDNRRVWVENSDEPFNSSALQSQYLDLDEPKPKKEKEEFDSSQQFDDSELNSTCSLDESNYTVLDQTGDLTDDTLDEAVNLDSDHTPDVSMTGIGSLESSFSVSLNFADYMRDFEGQRDNSRASGSCPHEDEDDPRTSEAPLHDDDEDYPRTSEVPLHDDDEDFPECPAPEYFHEKHGKLAGFFNY